MRKIILQLAVSLDGYIEGPNGEYDWCFTDQDYGMKAFFERIDSVFYGRKSFELTQTMFETMDSGALPDFPELTEYVFSNTIKEAKPGVIIISGDIEKEVKRIKNDPGRDIWLFGGASLASSLMEMGLVDEISLAVHPIILGSGKPLFSGINNRIPLKLLNIIPYSSGLVLMNYTLAQTN